MNNFSLSGMNILVTGAAGDIGTAIAKVSAGLGANLVLVDNRPMDATEEAVRAQGGQALQLIADVTDRQAVEDACRRAGRIDASVLNAGICPFDDWMADDWDEALDRVLAVNVRGTVNFARAILPGMLDRGSGQIVIMGSVSGFTGGGTFAGTPPHYVISKGGIHTFTRWLAQRGAGRVRVNGVAPGTVNTLMTAGQDFVAPAHQIMKRKAEVEEIAWPVAFLCSPASSYITGTILDVNGGLYVR